MSKAFDTVNHYKLAAKLLNTNIPPPTLNIFSITSEAAKHSPNYDTANHSPNSSKQKSHKVECCPRIYSTYTPKTYRLHRKTYNLRRRHYNLRLTQQLSDSRTDSNPFYMTYTDGRKTTTYNSTQAKQPCSPQTTKIQQQSKPHNRPYHSANDQNPPKFSD